MIKKYLKVFIQITSGLILYYLLRTYIENDFILIGILVAVVFVFLLYGVMFTKRNPADYLEVICDYDKFVEYVGKNKLDQNLKNILDAYGYVHSGQFDKASEVYSKVNEAMLDEKNPHQYFMNEVIKLELMFNDGDSEGLLKTLLKAIELNRFENVKVPKDMYKVHYFILEKEYEKAAEIAMEVIPQLRKRVYIIELEYLLALSYYHQKKYEDCKAVCEFITAKGHNIAYTSQCKELLVKLPQ